MLSPRLSWIQDKTLNFSQMVLFERSPKDYADQYIYDVKQRVSRNMAYGSMMADGLESDEATGDPLLDLVMARLPKFEKMELPVFADLESGKENIKIRAMLDSAKEDLTAFKEYKTSIRKWTQKMVDDSGQVTFYATTIWLKTGVIPTDIELINAQTAYTGDGGLTVTGDIWRFPTKRTMVDIIKMTSRIKKAHKGIKELCEKELL